MSKADRTDLSYTHGSHSSSVFFFLIFGSCQIFFSSSFCNTNTLLHIVLGDNIRLVFPNDIFLLFLSFFLSIYLSLFCLLLSLYCTAVVNENTGHAFIALTNEQTNYIINSYRFIRHNKQKKTQHQFKPSTTEVMNPLPDRKFVRTLCNLNIEQFNPFCSDFEIISFFLFQIPLFISSFGCAFCSFFKLNLDDFHFTCTQTHKYTREQKLKTNPFAITQ